MTAVSRGPLWDRMDGPSRFPVADLTHAEVPVGPGVYAWYRQGPAVYVSKADSLHEHTRTSHKGQSDSMGTSAFRRNVAEVAGIDSLTLLLPGHGVPGRCDRGRWLDDRAIARYAACWRDLSPDERTDIVADWTAAFTSGHVWHNSYIP